MANALDQLNNYLKTLQAQPIVRQVTGFLQQNPTPISYVQNQIANYATQNPTQAGQILSATKPLQNLVSTLQRPPVSYVPTVAQAVRTLVTPQKPVAPVAQAAPRVQIPKIISQVPRTSGGGFGALTASSNTRTQGGNQGTVSGAMTQAQQQALQKQLFDQAKARNAPYYQRLLEENNYDINAAKAALEKGYQTGIRQSKEASDTETKTLFGQTIPQEQVQMAENLNARGLLDTPTGAAQQISGTLSTGEKVSPTNPYMTQSYGGLAGNLIGKQVANQQARAEAIGKALANREENLSNQFQPEIARQQTALERAPYENEQAARAKALQESTQQFQDIRALQQGGLSSAYVGG